MTITPVEAADRDARGAAIRDAEIVVSTGAAGVSMLEEGQWSHGSRLKLIADANASPPLGIDGIDMKDRATPRHGALAFGPLGFGALKLALHRECVGRLFESNDQTLDAEQIFERARALLAQS
jgi:hypothetical protein